MKFSERKGIKKISNIIQKSNLNKESRNLLWNIFLERKDIHNQFRNNYDLKKAYWVDYNKQTLDTLPRELYGKFKIIILSQSWSEVYDLLEFILNFVKDAKLNQSINEVLESELSGYRFVNGQVTDITDKQEIEMLDDALTDEDFPNVKAHLQRALELLSDRKSPDYRNSIKESISAVESIAKEIAQKPKAELGEALKEIEKKGELHGALKKGFLSLYGYTSDANGIRHSLMEESNLTANDAKFFLLVCTSFINYLKTKI